MDHRREQILAAIQTAVTGLTTTGTRVDRGRDEEIPAENTPALRIAQGADPIADPWAQSLLDSEVGVVVKAKVHTSASNVDTLLNQIDKEVNIALTANQTLG